MYLFLVDLTAGCVRKTPRDANSRIRDEPAHPPPIADSARPVSDNVARLIAMKRLYDRFIATMSEPEMHAIIDQLCGKHVAPTRQYYAITSEVVFDGQSTITIEDAFFHGQPLPPGAIKVVSMCGKTCLVVENAHVRRLSVTISNVPCPLVRFDHCAPDKDAQFVFPLVERSPEAI